jgi:hypothetical protein
MGTVSFLKHIPGVGFVPVYRPYDPEPEPVDSDHDSIEENEAK